MKKRIDDLAVFGGRALFERPLHVGRPNLPPFEAFSARIRRVFERGWLTNRGPAVLEFEARIAALVGVRHCIAVCNATVGLEVASRALGMRGEVIVPSFTFVATAHSLSWQGIEPVFCDIDPASHTIDPRRIEALITPRTTGIVGVHVWGRVCDVEALEVVARRRNLRLLFDAAHAFGCSRRGRTVGGFGDAEVFSFHATKFLNAFEGGAIVTDDDELAGRVRLMTNFGFVANDHVVSVGTNGKMTEASAAMGLASLDFMPEVLECNRRNYRQYAASLEGVSGVKLFGWDDANVANLQYVVLEVNPAASGIHRDALLAVLQAENVLARRYFYPGVHRMEPYRRTWRGTTTLPNTDALSEQVLVLPTGLAVGNEEIDGICGLIRLCADHGPEVTSRLSQEMLRGVPDLR